MWPFPAPTDEVARIGVPTLALAGSKGTPQMLAAQQTVAAAIPGSEHVVLDGQTHQVSPAALAPALDAFFSRHRARA